MAGNTEILIKRSTSTDVPSSLKQGELAFSYTSNTLFIGSENGDSAVAIGYYNDFSGEYVNGANTYGDNTHIPIITLAANGLITSVNTTVISTTLGIDGDTGGPSSVNLLDETLTITGGEGITSTVNGQTITLDVDTTVVRSNTASLNQTIDGDVQISGNLTILGTQTTINVANYKVEDSLIYLASNNYTSDIVDIGFVGNYFDGSTQRHAGLFRHAGDQQFYIFDNYDKEPDANTVNPADASFQLATLHANVTAPTANITQANITSANVTSDLGVDGSAYVGTNLVVTGTTTLTGQANTTNDLGVGGNAYVTGSTVIDQQLYVNNLTNANTNYVVYYDTSTKELKYDTLDTLAPDNLANGSAYFAVSSNGESYASGKILAAQSSSGTSGGGFSFTGTEGGADTGMFSSSDGVLDFYANNVQIAQLTQTSIQVYTDLTFANNNVIGDDSGGLYFGSNITGVTTGSIVINNSGNSLTAATEGLFIDPVRFTATQDATYDGLMFYNASSKEIRYSYTLDGGSF